MARELGAQASDAPFKHRFQRWVDSAPFSSAWSTACPALTPARVSLRRTSATAAPPIFLLVAAALFIGAGIWLVDALLAARKADECMSGGRNCAHPVQVQPPQR